MNFYADFTVIKSMSANDGKFALCVRDEDSSVHWFEAYWCECCGPDADNFDVKPLDLAVFARGARAFAEIHAVGEADAMILRAVDLLSGAYLAKLDVAKQDIENARQELKAADEQVKIVEAARRAAAEKLDAAHQAYNKLRD